MGDVAVFTDFWLVMYQLQCKQRAFQPTSNVVAFSYRFFDAFNFERFERYFPAFRRCGGSTLSKVPSNKRATWLPFHIAFWMP